MAQQRYAQFVAEGINASSPLSNLKGQVFLGDEQFVLRMQARLRSGKDDVQIPIEQRRPPPPPLAEISSVMHKTEMQPSSKLTRRAGILTNDSLITLGYTSRRWGKLLGASDDVHLF